MTKAIVVLVCLLLLIAWFVAYFVICLCFGAKMRAHRTGLVYDKWEERMKTTTRVYDIGLFLILSGAILWGLFVP